MMPSTEKEYRERIKQAEHKATEQWHLAIRRCVSVVNSDKYLSEEDKKRIIEGFYK